MLLMHMLVSGGIAIAAVGGSGLYSDASDPSKVSTDRGLLKAGYLILLVAVILLAALAIFTLLRLRSVRSKGSANRLLYSVLAALPFVAVRVIYSVVYAFTLKPSLSTLTGTFAVKFVLIFLVQLVAACCLIAGGLFTLDIKQEIRSTGNVEVVMERGKK
jgi:ABC-type Co2+ transport system permease subunit